MIKTNKVKKIIKKSGNTPGLISSPHPKIKNKFGKIEFSKKNIIDNNEPRLKSK